ncbi:gamma-glutamylcyclotransferase [Granulicella cerasi]|uniref:Gamma-glutamylcyclotransferase n=1 Tax=Granulicella cerasi TaxID=741063 RepID=A0ABW1Z8U5_9BACT|nr:gamma-glutamylcyclotransferase family protein [Granulicella cerasi]
MLDLIFVYGTLHPDRAPAEMRDIVEQLVPAGRATLRARIYRFQHYPALILDAKAEAVEGALFRVPNDALFAALDEYEGFMPDAHDNSLFIRKQVTVLLTSGQPEQAWVYEYAQAV